MDSERELKDMAASADNQYLLALALAKRVRSLKSGAPPITDVKGHVMSPADVAMAEFANGLIDYGLSQGKGASKSKDQKE